MIRWMFAQERGQSVVELALVATLLLSLVGGIVDFGSAFHHYIIITNAAREGARQGSRIPCVDATVFTNNVKQAAISEATGSGITLAVGNITIAPTGCPSAGDELTVTVAFDYTPMMGGILGIGNFTIRNAVKMVFFGNDQG